VLSARDTTDGGSVLASRTFWVGAVLSVLVWTALAALLTGAAE
jgi:hypothetical protein